MMCSVLFVWGGCWVVCLGKAGRVFFSWDGSCHVTVTWILEFHMDARGNHTGNSMV